jgi:hypothetical protein
MDATQAGVEEAGDGEEAAADGGFEAGKHRLIIFGVFSGVDRVPDEELDFDIDIKICNRNFEGLVPYNRRCSLLDFRGENLTLVHAQSEKHVR